MNNKIKKILLKKNKSKIVCLTAYSKSIAKILDRHVDIVLVGDSMANVLYGMKNTHKISLDTIIQHSISVRKGIKKSLMVVDMPKGSYKNPSQAKKNAKLILSKTKFIEGLYKNYICEEYSMKYRFKLYSKRIINDPSTTHLVIRNY